MGNKLSNQQQSSQILNKYWQYIDNGLYKNKSTSEIIKQIKLSFRTQDQLKYVFNCLLKRVNNYHPNVIKIVYLRKLSQPNSICQCGNKFIILLYIENLQYKLKNFIASNSYLLPINNTINSNIYQNKCICLQIIKGILYLKQRYGSFRITQNNCWIQLTNKNHQITKTQKQQYSTSFKNDNKQKYQNGRNIKVKVWISSQQQQNYPDQSCQQKQMCFSLIQLIKRSLIPARLCKCYFNAQVLDKYVKIHKVKQLCQLIKRDHQSTNKVQDNKDFIRQIQNRNNHIQNKESIPLQRTISIQRTIPLQKNIPLQKTIPFQRTIRSYSSHQSNYQPTYNNYISYQKPQQVANHNQQFNSQRKYASIQYVRKPIQMYNSAQSKKQIKTPIIIHQQTQFISQKHSIINKPKSYSFQQTKHHQDSFKTDHSSRKNQIKVTFKYNEIENKHTKPNSINLQQLRNAYNMNPKIKYRHGNNLISKPIIKIADSQTITTQVINKIPIIPIPQLQEKIPNRQQSLQLPVHQLQSNRDATTQRQSQYLQEIVDISKINYSLDNFKKHHESSLDKGTNPTDRTKFQISSKGQSKKQPDTINSSRKNISITPISLDSTSGACSLLKPVLHSHDHFHQQDQKIYTDFYQVNYNQSNKLQIQSKQKKQSASSSKSQRNYLTYQLNFPTLNKLDQSQNLIFKQTNSKFEVPNRKQSQIRNEQKQANRQKSGSFFNKVDSLQANQIKNEIGRLRKSQYLVSGGNSFVNSQMISRKQSKELSQNKSQTRPIFSLAQMQAKFSTNQNIQHNNYLQEDNQRQIQTEELKYLQEQQNEQKKMVYVDQLLNNNYKYQSNQKGINYSKSHHQIQGNILNECSQLSNNQPSNKRSSPLNNQRQNYITDKVSSLVMRQQQQPINFNVHQDQYRIKIKTQQNYISQKAHQKNLSNPLFDKNYMIKNKSLKQQFKNLLDFPKQDSFKALSQNKDKLMILDPNQGRQTYSIYNQSQYNNSQHVSKQQSQRQLAFKHPPLPHKETTKQNKWRKPFTKNDLQKQLNMKKQTSKQIPTPQQILRLTSSGHEDNSIKQKVRNKKAQFAQLKNQMNNLLL